MLGSSLGMPAAKHPFFGLSESKESVHLLQTSTVALPGKIVRLSKHAMQPSSAECLEHWSGGRWDGIERVTGAKHNGPF